MQPIDLAKLEGAATLLFGANTSNDQRRAVEAYVKSELQYIEQFPSLIDHLLNPQATPEGLFLCGMIIRKTLADSWPQFTRQTEPHQYNELLSRLLHQFILHRSIRDSNLPPYVTKEIISIFVFLLKHGLLEYEQQAVPFIKDTLCGILNLIWDLNSSGGSTSSTSHARSSNSHSNQSNPFNSANSSNLHNMSSNTAAPRGAPSADTTQIDLNEADFNLTGVSYSVVYSLSSRSEVTSAITVLLRLLQQLVEDFSFLQVKRSANQHRRSATTFSSCCLDRIFKLTMKMVGSSVATGISPPNVSANLLLLLRHQPDRYQSPQHSHLLHQLDGLEMFNNDSGGAAIDNASIVYDLLGLDSSLSFASAAVSGQRYSSAGAKRSGGGGSGGDHFSSSRRQQQYDGNGNTYSNSGNAFGAAGSHHNPAFSNSSERYNSGNAGLQLSGDGFRHNGVSAEEDDQNLMGLGDMLTPSHTQAKQHDSFNTAFVGSPRSAGTLTPSSSDRYYRQNGNSRTVALSSMYSNGDGLRIAPSYPNNGMLTPSQSPIGGGATNSGASDRPPSVGAMMIRCNSSDDKMCPSMLGQWATGEGYLGNGSRMSSNNDGYNREGTQVYRDGGSSGALGGGGGSESDMAHNSNMTYMSNGSRPLDDQSSPQNDPSAPSMDVANALSSENVYIINRLDWAQQCSFVNTITTTHSVIEALLQLMQTVFGFDFQCQTPNARSNGPSGVGGAVRIFGSGADMTGGPAGVGGLGGNNIGSSSSYGSSSMGPSGGAGGSGGGAASSVYGSGDNLPGSEPETLHFPKQWLSTLLDSNLFGALLTIYEGRVMRPAGLSTAMSNANSSGAVRSLLADGDGGFGDSHNNSAFNQSHSRNGVNNPHNASEPSGYHIDTANHSNNDPRELEGYRRSDIYLTAMSILTQLTCARRSLFDTEDERASWLRQILAVSVYLFRHPTHFMVGDPSLSSTVVAAARYDQQIASIIFEGGAAIASMSIATDANGNSLVSNAVGSYLSSQAPMPSPLKHDVEALAEFSRLFHRTKPNFHLNEMTAQTNLYQIWAHSLSAFSIDCFLHWRGRPDPYRSTANEHSQYHEQIYKNFYTTMLEMQTVNLASTGFVFGYESTSCIDRQMMANSFPPTIDYFSNPFLTVLCPSLPPPSPRFVFLHLQDLSQQIINGNGNGNNSNVFQGPLPVEGIQNIFRQLYYQSVDLASVTKSDGYLNELKNYDAGTLSLCAGWYRMASSSAYASSESPLFLDEVLPSLVFAYFFTRGGVAAATAESASLSESNGRGGDIDERSPPPPEDDEELTFIQNRFMAYVARHCFSSVGGFLGNIFSSCANAYAQSIEASLKVWADNASNSRNGDYQVNGGANGAGLVRANAFITSKTNQVNTAAEFQLAHMLFFLASMLRVRTVNTGRPAASSTSAATSPTSQLSPNYNNTKALPSSSPPSINNAAEVAAATDAEIISAIIQLLEVQSRRVEATLAAALVTNSDTPWSIVYSGEGSSIHSLECAFLAFLQAFRFVYLGSGNGNVGSVGASATSASYASSGGIYAGTKSSTEAAPTSKVIPPATTLEAVGNTLSSYLNSFNNNSGNYNSNNVNGNQRRNTTTGPSPSNSSTSASAEIITATQRKLASAIIDKAARCLNLWSSFGGGNYSTPNASTNNVGSMYLHSFDASEFGSSTSQMDSGGQSGGGGRAFSCKQIITGTLGLLLDMSASANASGGVSSSGGGGGASAVASRFSATAAASTRQSALNQSPIPSPTDLITIQYLLRPEATQGMPFLQEFRYQRLRLRFRKTMSQILFLDGVATEQVKEYLSPMTVMLADFHAALCGGGSEYTPPLRGKSFFASLDAKGPATVASAGDIKDDTFGNDLVEMITSNGVGFANPEIQSYFGSNRPQQQQQQNGSHPPIAIKGSRGYQSLKTTQVRHLIAGVLSDLRAVYSACQGQRVYYHCCFDFLFSLNQDGCTFMADTLLWIADYCTTLNNMSLAAQQPKHIVPNSDDAFLQTVASPSDRQQLLSQNNSSIASSIIAPPIIANDLILEIQLLRYVSEVFENRCGRINFDNQSIHGLLLFNFGCRIVDVLLNRRLQRLAEMVRMLEVGSCSTAWDSAYIQQLEALTNNTNSNGQSFYDLLGQFSAVDAGTNTSKGYRTSKTAYIHSRLALATSAKILAAKGHISANLSSQDAKLLAYTLFGNPNYSVTNDAFHYNYVYKASYLLAQITAKLLSSRSCNGSVFQNFGDDTNERLFQNAWQIIRLFSYAELQLYPKLLKAYFVLIEALSSMFPATPPSVAGRIPVAPDGSKQNVHQTMLPLLQQIQSVSSNYLPFMANQPPEDLRHLFASIECLMDDTSTPSAGGPHRVNYNSSVASALVALTTILRVLHECHQHRALPSVFTAPLDISMHCYDRFMDPSVLGGGENYQYDNNNDNGQGLFAAFNGTSSTAEYYPPSDYPSRLLHLLLTRAIEEERGNIYNLQPVILHLVCLWPRALAAVEDRFFALHLRRGSLNTFTGRNYGYSPDGGSSVSDAGEKFRAVFQLLLHQLGPACPTHAAEDFGMEAAVSSYFSQSGRQQHYSGGGGATSPTCFCNLDPSVWLPVMPLDRSHKERFNQNLIKFCEAMKEV